MVAMVMPRAEVGGVPSVRLCGGGCYVVVEDKKRNERTTTTEFGHLHDERFNKMSTIRLSLAISRRW